ncbi:MAG: DUF2703 domain-containing protein [Candidatus Aenigmatarchaeota archaeon]
MSLNIKWQRLVVEGETCERCGSTRKEVKEAVDKLKGSLEPLGIDVNFEEESLSEEEFRKDPKSSNEIFIDGKPLEYWLDVDVGESECCDVCGDENCRTVRVNGEEYEVVPRELIIEASLKAASQKNIGGCCATSKSCCG